MSASKDTRLEVFPNSRIPRNPEGVKWAVISELFNDRLLGYCQAVYNPNVWGKGLSEEIR